MAAEEDTTLVSKDRLEDEPCLEQELLVSLHQPVPLCVMRQLGHVLTNNHEYASRTLLKIMMASPMMRKKRKRRKKRTRIA
eukprot:4863105-Amphidinium_carterae.2